MSTTAQLIAFFIVAQIVQMILWAVCLRIGLRWVKAGRHAHAVLRVGMPTSE